MLDRVRNGPSTAPELEAAFFRVWGRVQAGLRAAVAKANRKGGLDRVKLRDDVRFNGRLGGAIEVTDDLVLNARGEEALTASGLGTIDAPVLAQSLT